MSLRSNFKQAINEIGGSGSKSEGTDVQERTMSNSQTGNQLTTPPGKTSGAPERTVAEMSRPMNQPTQIQSTAQTTTAPVEKQNSETAIITADTQIHGAIVTKSPLVVKGKVKGNILCEETVRLTGEIEGNVTAMSIEVKGASIKGDLRMKYAAVFEEGTRLNGNLDADSAVINGSVDGDMRINGNLKILQASKINGDIYTGSLEIAKGAVISGKVSVGVVEDKGQKPETKPAPATAAPAKPAPAATSPAKPAADGLKSGTDNSNNAKA